MAGVSVVHLVDGMPRKIVQPCAVLSACGVWTWWDDQRSADTNVVDCCRCAWTKKFFAAAEADQ